MHGLCTQSFPNDQGSFFNFVLFVISLLVSNRCHLARHVCMPNCTCFASSETRNALRFTARGAHVWAGGFGHTVNVCTISRKPNRSRKPFSTQWSLQVYINCYLLNLRVLTYFAIAMSGWAILNQRRRSHYCYSYLCMCVHILYATNIIALYGASIVFVVCC